MTDDDLEALSRLLADDLDADAAAALRTRLAEDPALAAQWTRMQGLPHALNAWADQQVPMHLHDRILDQAARATDRTPVPAVTPRWGWPAQGAALLAAVALGLVLGRTTAPILTLEQQVSGRADVDLPGVSVAVDGVATLRVEPQSGLSREAPANDPGDPMKTHTLLAAAAGGALLTLTVQQGSATLLTPGPDGHAPTATVLATPAAPAAPAHPRRPRAPTASHGADAADRAATDPLAFENALLRGQLLATEGEPQAWPPQVDPQYTPTALREGLEAHLGDQGEIVVADCDEYPCLHFIEYDMDAVEGDQTDALNALMGAMTEGAWAGAKVPNVFVRNLTHEDGRRMLIAGIAVQTPEDLQDPDLQQRLNVRGSRLLDELRNESPQPDCREFEVISGGQKQIILVDEHGVPCAAPR